MHFADLVIDTGIKQNALGGGGFTGIDVRTDTNVPVMFYTGLASHGVSSFLRCATQNETGK
jgi:hypothetical protein